MVIGGSWWWTNGRAGSVPEAGQINHEEGRDVIGLAPEVLLPEALLPEPEALHVLVVVTEGREPKWCALQLSIQLWPKLEIKVKFHIKYYD